MRMAAASPSIDPAGEPAAYLDAGLKVMKLGEMARIPLQRFTLEGGARSNLRYALRRGERDGLAFEIIESAELPGIIDELEEISNAWLAKHAAATEKRYSVAAFRRDFVMAQPVALLREHGRLVAFATVMTTDLKDEATVGLMRSRPDIASGYAMEYLFVQLLRHFRENGYQSFSLGMAPLSGFGFAPAGIALVSPRAVHLVPWPSLLQFSGPAYLQKQVRSGMGAPLSRRLRAVRNLFRSGRHRDAGQRRCRATDRIAAPTRRQGATTRRAGERLLSGSRDCVSGFLPSLRA